MSLVDDLEVEGYRLALAHATAAGNGWRPWPHIHVSPGMMGGRPVVAWDAPHRITAELVAEVWWQGLTLDEIAETWPFLTPDVVLVACWFQARWGTWTWRRRWGDWLREHGWRLGWSQPDPPVPMPPQRATAGGAG